MHSQKNYKTKENDVDLTYLPVIHVIHCTEFKSQVCATHKLSKLCQALKIEHGLLHLQSRENSNISLTESFCHV